MHIDRLITIPSADLPRLRDMYRVDWPLHIAGFSVLETCVRWQRQHGCQRAGQWFDVYSLNGDWSDGTFVCVHRTTWIFVDTLGSAGSTDRLTSAMQLLDWQRGLRVSYFRDRHLSAQLAVEARLQLTVELECCFLVYHMPREQAMLLDTGCPADVRLGALKPQHAQLVNDAWPTRHEGSLAWFEHLIENNPSVGLFPVDGAAADRPIGWVLKYENGPIGSIYVVDEYKRRGLGSVLLHAMARLFAKMDLDVFAFVRPRNLASRRMFEKSGFRRMAEPIWWTHTWPDASGSSKL